MQNNELKKYDFYNQILEVVSDLHNMGVLSKSSGQCFAISDIVSKLLKNRGIDCVLVECNLLMINKRNNSLNLIGYDKNSIDPRNMINNHIVCITKTEVPILIDLSVPFLSQDNPYIIEVANYKNGNIGEYDYENSYWVYSEKTFSQIPLLHQKSIVDRIKKDIEVDDKLENIDVSISKLRKFIIITIGLVLLNFIRGFYDFNQKYIIKNNGFGPIPQEKVNFK